MIEVKIKASEATAAMTIQSFLYFLRFLIIALFYHQFFSFQIFADCQGVC